MNEKWYKFKSDPDQFGNWFLLCIILSTIGAIFVAMFIGEIFIHLNIKPKFIDPVGLYMISFFGLVMGSLVLLKKSLNPARTGDESL